MSTPKAEWGNIQPWAPHHAPFTRRDLSFPSFTATSATLKLSQFAQSMFNASKTILALIYIAFFIAVTGGGSLFAVFAILFLSF